MLKRNLLSKASAFALAGVLWGSLATPCWAMEKDDAPKSTLTITQPHEIGLKIFSYLSPKALCRIASVSKEWNELSSSEYLWNHFLKELGFEIPENFPSKKMVFSALNKSTVNGIIATLWSCTQNTMSAKIDNERFVALGYKKAINMKIERVLSNPFDPDSNPQTAADLNKKLVAEGDWDAINRKIEGLLEGTNGYAQDPQAGKDLNEKWAQKGSRDARMRLLIDLGWFDSQESQKTSAVELNDKWAEEGDLHAIDRKVNRLNGSNPEAERIFLEWAIGQGSAGAINKKEERLIFGCYGYSQDETELKEFKNELMNSTNPNIIDYHFSKANFNQSSPIGYFSNKKDYIKWLVDQGIPIGIETSIRERIYEEKDFLLYTKNQVLLDTYIKLLAND